MNLDCDLLRECFSYLGDAADNLNAGHVCKYWLSSIDHPLSWRGCIKLNEEFIKEFIETKYFKYLGVNDFTKLYLVDICSFDTCFSDTCCCIVLRKQGWLHELNNGGIYPLLFMKTIMRRNHS